MANTFKNYKGTSITTETTILTGGVGTTTTIIGMTLANTSGVTVTVSVKLGTAYLVKDVPIPVGGALVPVGGEQKVVVMDGDTLNVISSGTVDTIVSVLEIS